MATTLAMTEEFQADCLKGRTVGMFVRVEDGRVAVLDHNGHTIFVCRPECLPVIKRNDINF